MDSFWETPARERSSPFRQASRRREHVTPQESLRNVRCGRDAAHNGQLKERVVAVLVLTRKIGDVIAIGDNIKIVVMAIKGKQVRLGIQADKDTVVHREEVYQKIQQEIKEAQKSRTDSVKIADKLLKTAHREQEAAGSGNENEPATPRYVLRRVNKSTEN